MPYLGPEGVGGYRRKCAEVPEKGYEGFVFTSAGQGFMGPPRWANFEKGAALADPLPSLP